MMSTAMGGGSRAMHEVHDGTNGADVRFGQHAMAEVEDVAGSAFRPLEYVADLTVALSGGSKERRGIEVALNGAFLPDAVPCRIERQTPCDAEHVTAGPGKIFEEARGSGTEMNQRHSGFGRARQYTFGMRLDVGAVIVRREASDPAVEELQSVCAGARLSGEVAADQIRKLVQQDVPGVRCLVHEPLGLRERATGASLDRVTRERKRRARESDQRHIGGQRTARQPNGLENVPQLLLGIDVRQPAHVRRGGDWAVDAGPFARREAQAQIERV